MRQSAHEDVVLGLGSVILGLLPNGASEYPAESVQIITDNCASRA